MNTARHMLLAILFSFALLTAVFTGQAAACTCVLGIPLCQEYWKADVVFAGTVVSIEEKKEAASVDDLISRFSPILVRLAVTEIFRGPQAAQLEISTGRGGGDCGYHFSKGTAYLVYAHRNKQNGRLYTNICSRTSELARAAEDLSYIRGLAEAAPTATVYGKVMRQNYSRAPGANFHKPIAAVAVFIEGESRRIATRTDAEGRYQFAGLNPGAYQVKLKPPPGLIGYKLNEEGMIETKVEVVARSCSQADFYFQSDTAVSGRVVDAAGQPVADLPLAMRGVARDLSNVNSFHHAHTDAEGRFEFKPLPPGDYLLGFRIMSGGGGRDLLPFPRTYYPGVAAKAQARIISVKEGEQLTDLELRLAPRLSERDVEVLVVWEDGRPAPVVNINLWLFEEGEISESKSFRADERGRFTLKLYEELDYKVTAYPLNAIGAAAGSKAVEVPRTPLSAPLNLVLPVLKKAPEKTAKPN